MAPESKPTIDQSQPKCTQTCLTGHRQREDPLSAPMIAPTTIRTVVVVKAFHSAITHFSEIARPLPSQMEQETIVTPQERCLTMQSVILTRRIREGDNHLARAPMKPALRLMKTFDPWDFSWCLWRSSWTLRSVTTWPWLKRLHRLRTRLKLKRKTTILSK